jgi:hypothetical protein
MKFLLLIRGSFEKWNKYSPEVQKIIIDDFKSFAGFLKEKSSLIHGDPCGERTFRIQSIVKCNEQSLLPNMTSEMVTGYFVISANSEEEALSLVRECPAFKYEETVELIPILGK